MTRFALAIAVWLVAAAARADMPVYPKRPEWDDTPLPMPDVPSLVIALAALAVVLVVLSRRAER